MAQNELLGGSATIIIVEKKIHVEQLLEVQLPDSVSQLTLRILDFKGSLLSDISIVSNEKETDFKDEKVEGLHTIKIISNEGFKQLKLSYWVTVREADFYIPFFFTDLPAVNSDNDFFKLNISLPKTQEYVLHFPNVALNETYKADSKNISLAVPALISVLRMELLESENQHIRFASLMDGLVGGIFVVIGILIWINRKRLAYG